MYDFRKVACSLLVGALGALPACVGDPGATGPAGDPGVGCTATDNGDGTLTVNCGGDDVLISSGQDGEPGAAGTPGEPGAPGATGATGVAGPAGAGCTAVDNNDGTYTVTCGGESVTVSDGTDGEDVDPAALAQLEALAAVGAESCAVCHADAGSAHQAVYDEYTDATAFGLTIDTVVSVPGTAANTFNTTVTFSITKDGLPYIDANKLPSLDQKRIMGIEFVGGQYLNAISFPTPSSGLITATATPGQYTVQAIGVAYALETKDAAVYAYVGDGVLNTEGMKMYGDVASAAKTFNNFSTLAADSATATVSGCVKCHGAPYAKHGYRFAEVIGLPDFAACKFCHFDTKAGGHQDWQVLVDDPARYAAISNGPTPLTAEEKAKYAYIATVMNDTHMSHAMEFAYPQSMANCATCHEGKLDLVLTDANFVAATCKSCHPVTGSVEYGTAALALNTLMPAGHNIDTMASCNTCHKSGGIGQTFAAIHTGYDKKIYANAAGDRYSDLFTATIDSASLTDNVLTVSFKVVEDAASTVALNPTDVVPTILIGLYGWDTKDFIVAPHDRDANNFRLLEYAANGTTAHPRFTTVSAAGGVWTITADLTMWADKLADGSVQRAEIGVMPKLVKVVGQVDTTANGEKDDITLALNAPSRTFDLVANAFDDGFYAPIVKVEQGCNTCHDALGTTFHSGDRGGNMAVCRLCHVTTSGGSHLEMQSRSIDSYVHAIHSFQPFDTKNINMTDPVEALRYKHHVDSGYPNFTIKNCKSCHNPGTFEVPDQSRSLPGLFSPAGVWPGPRNIGTVPAYIAGPASRACGACHRAKMINEDDAGMLASFNQHTKSNGYLVKSVTGLLSMVIDSVMTMFE